MIVDCSIFLGFFRGLLYYQYFSAGQPRVFMRHGVHDSVSH